MSEGSKTIAAKLTAKDADRFAGLARSIGTTVNGLLVRTVHVLLEQAAGLQAELAEHRRRGAELAASVDSALEFAAAQALNAVPGSKRRLADEIVHVWRAGDRQEAIRILTTLEGRARQHVEWALQRDHVEIWSEIRKGSRFTRVNPPKEAVQ